MKKILHVINWISWSSELTVNKIEAASKNIEEKSNIFMRSLDAYITKKILDVTLKIVAISIVILAKLNNSGGIGRGI